MGKKFITFSIMAMFCLICLLMTSCEQPEKTRTVFNKRFIHNIKPMMSYEELVKVIGTPGTIVKDAGESSPGVVHYHWDGGKDSALDARISGGKLVDATMLAPNGNSYSIGK
jgi:hypothetical protein